MKKKLALTSFYYINREIWSGDSKMLFAQTNQDATFSDNSKN